MGIANRNLEVDARRHQVAVHIDVSANAGTHQVVLYDANRDIKITRVSKIQSVDHTSGTFSDLEVGISTDVDKYVNFTLVDDTLWDVVDMTLLSTDLVTAGTPIVVGLSASATSDGEIDAVIEYEYVDRAQR